MQRRVFTGGATQNYGLYHAAGLVRSGFCLVLLIFASAFLTGSAALSQDYQHLAPQLLSAQPTDALALPPPPAIQIDSKTDLRPIISLLTGIRFVDSGKKVWTSGAVGHGIVIDGPALLSDVAIKQRLRAFIGHPLTMAVMKQVRADIAQWYRLQGRPFVDVVFPQQDISYGMLQGVVIEFRVGKIRTEGNSWFAGWLLESQMRLDTGDIIRTETLNEDIAWLNQNPFHQTTAVAEKGDRAGTTDIVLRTEDRFPLRVYASYDNTGVPAEGVNRWGLGMLWGDAFLLDQLLAYQFTSSDDFWSRPLHVSVADQEATLEAHSVNWIIPLPWRDKLIFSGLYEQDRPNLGQFLGEVGVSWQASARYAMPLPAFWGFTEDFQTGFDFKRTNNNFAFGGYNISNSLTDVAQIPILYTFSDQEPDSVLTLSNLLMLSPGRFDPNNTDAAFQPSASHFGVPYASARYAYDDFTFSRVARLIWDFSAIDHWQAQISTSNLVPSETIGAGGLDSVRGYDARTASGSLGILGTEEWRTSAISPTGLFSGAASDWDNDTNLAIGDALQFDAFWDFGYTRNNRVAPGASNGTTLMSVGCGAHYTWNRFIDFRVENGWQLRKAPGETQRESRLIFSAVLGN